MDSDTRRASEDATSPITEYGHKLLNLCSITGLRIMNGRVGMDKGVGKYTCKEPTGSSAVDYSHRKCVQASRPILL